MEYLESLGYVVLSVILFFIGKLIYQISHKKININHELIEKDNFAFSVSYVGYFAALVTIIGAALIGPSNGFWSDVLVVSLYTILGIILLNLSVIINNKLIFSKFDLRKEIIEDQNVGTGVIQAAVFITSGFVLFGAIIGESNSLVEGIMTAVAFWVLGMIILIITERIYSLTINFDVHAEIEKDNVAAGVAVAGAFLAIGILLMDALSHPFVDWVDSITPIAIEIGIGLLLLPIVRVIADKILLPGQKLTDEIVNQEKPNVGAALVEAFVYIGFALIISWSI